MSYIIGSLNACSLRTCSLNRIADIILSERFDVLAVQESKCSAALDILKNRYLRDFEASNSDWNGEFAFLWNTKRLKECSKDGMPDIFSQYHATTHLVREPYYGRFTPCGLLGGSFFEIRLINIHLHHGGNDSAENVLKRKREFEIVAGEIHESISKKRYGNKMPAYTIILGDYNLCCIICELQRATSITFLADTVQSEKTTLSNIKAAYVNDYDHISYSKERFTGTNLIVQRIDTVVKYVNNDFVVHRKEISNHVPIKIELTLNPRG